MSQPAGGEARREGLFPALKNLIATLLAIGKTRAELLVIEIEEEKFRLVSLLSKAIAALFLLGLGLVMAVCCLAVVFWEQRVVVFGLLALLFIVGGVWLIGALRHQAAQPSKLFEGSLAELDKDLAQLRRRDSAE